MIHGHYITVTETKEYFTEKFPNIFPLLEELLLKELSTTTPNFKGVNIIIKSDDYCELFDDNNTEKGKFLVMHYLIMNLATELARYSVKNTDGRANKIIKVFDEISLYNLENYNNTTSQIEEYLKHFILFIDGAKAMNNIHNEKDRGKFKQYVNLLLSKRQRNGLFINFLVLPEDFLPYVNGYDNVFIESPQDSSLVIV